MFPLITKFLQYNTCTSYSHCWSEKELTYSSRLAARLCALNNNNNTDKYRREIHPHLLPQIESYTFFVLLQRPFELSPYIRRLPVPQPLLARTRTIPTRRHRARSPFQFLLRIHTSLLSIVGYPKARITKHDRILSVSCSCSGSCHSSTTGKRCSAYLS